MSSVPICKDGPGPQTPFSPEHDRVDAPLMSGATMARPCTNIVVVVAPRNGLRPRLGDSLGGTPSTTRIALPPRRATRHVYYMAVDGARRRSRRRARILDAIISLTKPPVRGSYKPCRRRRLNACGLRRCCMGAAVPASRRGVSLLSRRHAISTRLHVHCC